MAKYAMDPAWEHEKERLNIQASFNDPGTRARVEALGIQEGWRCAEIGGGSGTVAAWLSARVGASGRVVATDTDTRFLKLIDVPNLEVRKHDIMNEALEPETYDLVHTRLLLVHLGEGRTAGLAHMVEALKPGGWLLAEEYDNVTTGTSFPRDEVQERVSAAMTPVAQQLGIEQQLGRQLPGLLEEAGLTDVQADGRVSLLKQGTEQNRAGTLFMRFQQNRLASTGLVTAEEIDALLERRASPGPARTMGPLMVAAWGRKPVAAGVSS